MDRAKTQALKGLLCALLLGGQFLAVDTGQAQTLPAIADEPIYTATSIQPNVMLTLDNSGSMAWQFAPMTTRSNLSRRCFSNHLYNKLFYNPSMVYRPPVMADGSTRYPDASYTAAWRDGFKPSSGTLNLSTGFPGVGNYAAQTNGNSNTNPAINSTPVAGAYYHKYTGSSPTTPVEGTCYADSSYTKVDMNSATAAEKTNYANWFSYYRTRINAMKTSAGEAFRVVDADFRVGLHTINSPGATGDTGAFIPVDTFSGSHRNTWYTRFYQLQPSGNTPLRAAHQRVGEYYRTGASPGGGAAPDPILHSCQQNYNLLTTDGQWNSTGASGTVGSTNWDRTLPSATKLLKALELEFGTVFTPGSRWPRPYVERWSSASTDTLSDIAAYYWSTDLRPGMTDNVFTSSKNFATWQHMVTYGLAFSEQGTIAYPDGLAAIRSGTSDWPKPSADQASAIDDLWHASLVGHGNFFSVSSPTELMFALGNALTEIRELQGSNSGSVLSGSDLAVGSTTAFRALYRTGEWSGDLQARQVDPVTGVISPTPVWRAQDILDAQVLPSGAGGGWSTKRKIVSRTNSTTTGVAVRFREPGFAGAGGTLTAAQMSILDPDTMRAKEKLAYLRGDRTHEDTDTVVRKYRRRGFVLGDIVNSEPRYVAAPGEQYSDAYHPGYTAHRNARQGRTPTVYVGSNDGMLHAFKATIGDADSGSEKWAYVPSFMFRPGVEGLAGLTWRQTDPLPNRFEHRYRVDQTPTIREVDFSRVGGAAGGTDWRTLLVAGLNKGGRGYYALDVTDPDAATEDAARSKVLWEFDGSETGDSARVGYSYGLPMVIYTNHGWLVAVSSGYQNATGTGHVWLLDPRDGRVVKRLDVPDNASASPANPVGLAQMEVFFQSEREQLVTEIYATDLRGNVWRFDLSGATPSAWPNQGIKLASVGAPITSSPAIAVNPRNRSERWVFFGTGRVLDTADLSVSATRTFYAIKDGSSSAPSPAATPIVRGDLVGITSADQAPEGSAVKGWYMDMVDAGGGQMTAPPLVARGVVMWSTTVPTSDPCSPGAAGVFYAREMGSARNRIANGDLYVTMNAPITKLQVAESSQTVGAPNSQRKQLMITSTSGADIIVDVNLQVVLTGGRSNLRFVTTR